MPIVDSFCSSFQNVHDLRPSDVFQFSIYQNLKEETWQLRLYAVPFPFSLNEWISFAFLTFEFRISQVSHKRLWAHGTRRLKVIFFMSVFDSRENFLDSALSIVGWNIGDSVIWEVHVREWPYCTPFWHSVTEKFRRLLHEGTHEGAEKYFNTYSPSSLLV